MTLNLSLPPELEIKLRERAAATGQDVGTFVRGAVEAKLAEPAPEANSGAKPRQGSPEWRALYHAWIAGHPAVPHLADDSRDAIYDDERD